MNIRLPFQFPAATLIVAYDKNRGIGYQGQIPWYISEDMRFFRNITDGQLVVMGRKTFQSLSKPLKNRYVVVMTKQNLCALQSYPAYDNNVAACSSYIKLLATCFDVMYKFNKTTNFIIAGGAEIYKQWLTYPGLYAILTTEIEAEYCVDTFFPQLPEGWTGLDTTLHCQGNLKYNRTLYVKKI